MCGGCGGGGGRDWASALVAGSVARGAVAVAATALCRAAGTAVRVGVGGGGWTVAAPTGAVTVAGTLTDLWAAVPVWRARVAERGLLPLDRLPGPPPAGGVAGPPPSGAGVRGRRVAVLVGVPAASELTWADALVDAQRPATDVVAGVDGTPPASRVLVVCHDRARVRPLLTALRASGPAQRWSVSALVERGGAAGDQAGDDGLDGLDGLDDGAVGLLLDGAVPPADAGCAGSVLDATRSHPAVAACWAGAAVAAGVAGPRLRVTTADGLVVDVVDHLVLGVREPAPWPTTTGVHQRGLAP